MFRKHSVILSKKLDKTEKKENGIFFTPKYIRTEMLEHIDFDSIHSVLEPSFGSGEFIYDICERKLGIEVTGVEINKNIFYSCRDDLLKLENNIQLFCTDFLTFQTDKKFDLIIGNPPYFYYNKSDKKDYAHKYRDILDGKFDICMLFVLKCLEMLENDGYLAFVLPRSIQSTISYSKFRHYIHSNFHILNIHTFETEHWIHTKQQTFCLIIQNKPSLSLDKFFLQIDKINIFQEEQIVKKLRNIVDNKTTIGNSKFPIKTGPVVWHKKLLNNLPNNCLLIRNSCIKNFKLENEHIQELYMDDEKLDKITVKQRVILVNRGHGNNGNLNIDFCIVDPKNFTLPILIENHIYIIFDNGTNNLNNLFQKLKSKECIYYIKHMVLSGCLTSTFLKTIPI